MKAQIGLGVLLIPKAFDTLGMIPGLIVVCLVAAITTWSDCMVGVFKQNHPDVYAIDEAVGKFTGRAGKEFIGAVYVLYWIFVAGSGMLGLSIGLNAVSVHATCTAVFVALAAILACIFGSIQTLHKISWLAWVGLIAIMSAIFTVTVAVGVQDHSADGVLAHEAFVSDWKLFASPGFAEAMRAVSAIVFAFSGTPAFFNIIGEMKEKKHATRSVLSCQSLVTATYIAIGCVVYYFCGSHVTSPALGSAGPLLKRISYGLSLPGLLVSSLLFVHVSLFSSHIDVASSSNAAQFPAKYIFVRALRGTEHLTGDTKTHWLVWLSCTAAVSLVAYIVANAIPVFDSLVSLIGALLGTMMCFQPMGMMWFRDNWKKDSAERKKASWRWWCMVVFSTFVIVSGTFIMIAGTYGTVLGIIAEYKSTSGTRPWSCADNSQSVGGR